MNPSVRAHHTARSEWGGTLCSEQYGSFGIRQEGSYVYFMLALWLLVRECQGEKKQFVIWRLSNQETDIEKQV